MNRRKPKGRVEPRRTLICLGYYAENNDTTHVFTVEEIEFICSRHQRDILTMCCACGGNGRRECGDNYDMQCDATSMLDCSYELPWYLS